MKNAYLRRLIKGFLAIGLSVSMLMGSVTVYADENVGIVESLSEETVEETELTSVETTDEQAEEPSVESSESLIEEPSEELPEEVLLDDSEEILLEDAAETAPVDETEETVETVEVYTAEPESVEEPDEDANLSSNSVTGDTGEEIFNELTQSLNAAPDWYKEKVAEGVNPMGRNDKIIVMSKESDVSVVKQQLENGVEKDLCVHSVSLDLDGDDRNSYIAYLGISSRNQTIRMRVLNTKSGEYSDYLSFGTAAWTGLGDSLLPHPVPEGQEAYVYSYFSITAGDYDNDGIDEIIAYVTPDKGTAGLCKVKAIAGDVPSIQMTQEVFYSDSILSNSSYYEQLPEPNEKEMYKSMMCDLATGDVNQDGIDDLALVSGCSNKTTVYGRPAFTMDPYLAVILGANGTEIMEDKVCYNDAYLTNYDQIMSCGVSIGRVLDGSDNNMIVVSGYEDDGNAGIYVYEYQKYGGLEEKIHTSVPLNVSKEKVVKDRFGLTRYEYSPIKMLTECVALDGNGAIEYIFTNNEIYKIRNSELVSFGLNRLANSSHTNNPVCAAVGNFSHEKVPKDSIAFMTYSPDEKKCYEYKVSHAKQEDFSVSCESASDDCSFDAPLTSYEKADAYVAKLRYNWSGCLYSNPIPMAILQTPPYFADLDVPTKSETEYEITFASAEGTGTSEEVSAGFGISVEAETACAKFSVEGVFKAGRSEEFETESKISQKSSISVEGGEEDQVWVCVTPVVVYSYDIYSSTEDKWMENATGLTYNQTPINHVMTVNQYNMFVEYYNNLKDTNHILKGELIQLNEIDPNKYGLDHRGDPEGYQDVAHDFVSSYEFDFSGTQSSERETETTEKNTYVNTLDNELTISAMVGFEVGGVGAWVGGSATASEGSSTSTMTATSKGSGIKCKVKAPEDTEGYSFTWSPATADFAPYFDGSTSFGRIPVVGYEVKNVIRGNLPTPVISAIEDEGNGKVSVQWKEPKHYDGQAIDGYNVHITDVIGNTVKDAYIEKHLNDWYSYSFESNDYGKNGYYFEISAVGTVNGKDRESKKSERKGKIINKTPNDKLPKPKLLSDPYVDTINKTLTLEWNNPTVEAGVVITGYDINILKGDTIAHTEHIGVKYPKNTYTYNYTDDKTSPDYYGPTIHGNIVAVGHYDNYFITSNEAGDWSVPLEEVSVKFDANGGDAVTDILKVGVGTTYGKLPTTTRAGMVFKGWYTERVDGTVVENDTVVTQDKDHILYAHWASQQVNVSFDANGGHCTPFYKLVRYKETYGDLPTPGNYNSNYHFIGWFTQKDGGSRIVPASRVESNQNHTLYAHWSYRYYCIDYILDGGRHEGNTPFFYTVDSDDLVLASAFKEGYTFLGWYDGDTRITKIEKGTDHNVTVTAKWQPLDLGVSVYDIKGTFTYTGSAIKPSVSVYNGNQKLVEGKDYKLTYKNNINAYSLTGKSDQEIEAKAPVAIITGMGNFSNKLVIRKYFEIDRVNLSTNAMVEASVKSPLIVYNNKANNLVPIVKYNGKALAKNKEFTFSYSGSAYENGVCKNPGVYTIHVSAVEGSNYTGSLDLDFEIVQNKVLMSSVSVDKIAAIAYDGLEHKPAVRVKYGKTTVLEEGTDYSLNYNDTEYKSAGNHTIEIVGLNGYVGKKTVSFTITGLPMSKVKVSGVINPTYDGTRKTLSVHTMENLKLTYTKGKGKSAETVELTTGDYSVQYLTQNTNVGTVKVKLIGKEAYTGSLVVSYKILPKNMADTTNVVIATLDHADGKYTYNKTGAKAQPQVMYNGMELTEGVDYTLSYKNINAYTVDPSNENKKASVTINGIKNYKGKITLRYVIEKSSIASANDLVKMIAPDAVFSTARNAKASKCFVSPILIEKETGKILKAGTDYEKTFVYTRKNGGTNVVIQKGDELPEVGTQITVTVKGKGNYESEELSATYRVISADSNISGYKVDAISKAYTGQPVKLNQSDLQIRKTKNAEPLSADDFEILNDTYMNNTSRGTASVYVRGKGSKGGLIKVNYTIVPQN